MKQASARLSLFVTALISSWGCATPSGGTQGISIREIKSENSVAHYPGEGGVVISSSREAKGNYLKSICVAPPAQAAQAAAFKAIAEIAAGADSNVATPAGVGVEAAASLSATRGYEATTSISQLFAQNERTLLLQYSLYRLCEAYMNGMFDPYASPISDLARLRAKLGGTDASSGVIDQVIASTVKAEEKIESLSQERDSLRQRAQASDQDEEKKKAQTRLAEVESQIRTLKEIYFKNTYREAFDSIMDTAVALAQIEKERAVAEAKASAERAKAEVETAKLNDKVAAAEKKAKEADESAKTAREQFEQLRKSIIDNSLTCLGCSKKEATTSPDKK
ncbi:hypothetical protein VZQ01_09655 [Myxococcus faecalis]|uniref:hypothetical protein n=1 Tax=Myxococcus faecalis TaxID=3115646 RepID=UPI003CF91F69